MHLRCRFMGDTCRRSSGCLDPHMVSTTCRHCFLMKRNKTVGKNVWKTCCPFSPKKTVRPVLKCFVVVFFESNKLTREMPVQILVSPFALCLKVSIIPYALCLMYQSYIHPKKTYIDTIRPEVLGVFCGFVFLNL